MNTSDISSRILAIRGHQTRSTFSKRLEINQASLRNYETGLAMPGYDFITKICSECDINSHWLLFGTGPMRRGEDSVGDHIYSGAPPQKTQEIPCAACTELKKELSIEREERRTLASENRHLWRENGDIREKHARIEERYHQDVVNRSNKESFVEISDAG